MYTSRQLKHNKNEPPMNKGNSKKQMAFVLYEKAVYIVNIYTAAKGVYRYTFTYSILSGAIPTERIPNGRLLRCVSLDRDRHPNMINMIMLFGNYLHRPTTEWTFFWCFVVYKSVSAVSTHSLCIGRFKSKSDDDYLFRTSRNPRPTSPRPNCWIARARVQPFTYRTI